MNRVCTHAHDDLKGNHPHGTNGYVKAELPCTGRSAVVGLVELWGGAMTRQSRASSGSVGKSCVPIRKHALLSRYSSWC